jgi:flap endonuclease-1
MSMIQEKCPSSCSETTMDMFSGKAIACDASMTIYHFIISTQAMKQGCAAIADLRDEEGNLTGHLVGLFHKTINLFECGIKPIWVFDGIPPKAKCDEMQKRHQAKNMAKQEGFQGEDESNMDRDRGLSMVGRSIRITPDMIKDAKTLLTLMGCAVFQAPSEAEAQCAEIVKQGLAAATASDDMDCLVHGTPI